MKLREVTEDYVYRIGGVDSVHAAANFERFHFRLVTLHQLTKEEWRGVESLAGRLSTSYLRCVYGSKSTALLLVLEEERVVAVLWVVPGVKIRERYPFVGEKSSAIIACVTHPSCRGLGVYPAGIRAIASSGHSQEYLIWSHRSNLASLKGIIKAGGVKLGEFTRVRWLRGLISSVYFRPEQPAEDYYG